MKSVGYALTRRCPRCGYRPVFTSWWSMTKACHGCGLVFERESGYWVGAMTINTVVISAVFLLTFGGGVLATWPDVPWGWVLGITVALNLLFPMFFYPFAKTLWMAVDLGFQGATDQDEFRS